MLNMITVLEEFESATIFTESAITLLSGRRVGCAIKRRRVATLAEQPGWCGQEIIV